MSTINDYKISQKLSDFACAALSSSLYDKKLLDEAKYDMKNYTDQGGCYPSKTEQI